MTHNGVILDTLPFTPAKMKDMAYIEGLKINLLTKHEKTLVNSLHPPVFYIDNVPSKMNKAR